MKTITYEPGIGSHILLACTEATNLAMREKANVAFRFNDVDLVATPKTIPPDLVDEWQKEIDAKGDAWRNSPEGIAYAERRERKIKSNQAAVDSALRELPGTTGLNAVVEWLDSFTAVGDDVDVEFDRETLAALLESKGFKANEGVGEKPEWFSTRERMGRYIVGQAITCLRRGMPPHPITHSFARQYRALPA